MVRLGRVDAHYHVPLRYLPSASHLSRRIPDILGLNPAMVFSSIWWRKETHPGPTKKKSKFTFPRISVHQRRQIFPYGSLLWTCCAFFTWFQEMGTSMLSVSWLWKGEEQVCSLHRMCCRDEPTPRILRAFISDERTELREIIIYTASLSSSRVVGRWCIASNTAYRLSTTCENASQARAHDIVRRASPVRRERAYSGIHRSWICLLQCPCLLLPMTRAVEVADLEPISSTVVIDIAVWVGVDCANCRGIKFPFL